MTNWHNLSLEYPWLLVLLLIIPIAIVIDFRKLRQKRGIQYSSKLLLPSHSNTWRVQLYKYGRVFQYLSLLLFIIAIAKPVLPLSEEKIEADGIDIAMVIDLSSSMLAQDFEPNRLEASKSVAISFIENRPHDHIALIAFAAESYTLSPLTTDKSMLITQVNQMDCGLLEDGTAIGMGLANAINRLKDGPSDSKIVILLTDGVNNTGYIQPMTAATIAKEKGIKVYSVGVGSMGEALSPVSRRADGQYIFGYTRVEIDEALMQEISEMTGGRYFRATDNMSLIDIYNTIDKLEKTKIEVLTIKSKLDKYSIFLLIGFGLLLLDVLIRNIFIQKLG